MKLGVYGRRFAMVRIEGDSAALAQVTMFLVMWMAAAEWRSDE